MAWQGQIVLKSGTEFTIAYISTLVPRRKSFCNCCVPSLPVLARKEKWSERKMEGTEGQ